MQSSGYKQLQSRVEIIFPKMGAAVKTLTSNQEAKQWVKSLKQQISAVDLPAENLGEEQALAQ